MQNYFTLSNTKLSFLQQVSSYRSYDNYFEIKSTNWRILKKKNLFSENCRCFNIRPNILRGMSFAEYWCDRLFIRIHMLFCCDNFVEQTVFGGGWLASSCVDHLWTPVETQIIWSGHPITIPLLPPRSLPSYVMSFFKLRWISISNTLLSCSVHSRALQASPAEPSSHARLHWKCETDRD